MLIEEATMSEEVQVTEKGLFDLLHQLFGQSLSETCSITSLTPPEVFSWQINLVAYAHLLLL